MLAVRTTDHTTTGLPDIVMLIIQDLVVLTAHLKRNALTHLDNAFKAAASLTRGIFADHKLMSQKPRWLMI